jgi:hypothetical protein
MAPHFELVGAVSVVLVGGVGSCGPVPAAAAVIVILIFGCGWVMVLAKNQSPMKTSNYAHFQCGWSWLHCQPSGKSLWP